MRRIINLGTVLALTAISVTVTASPARAATPSEVTVRFQLTLEGTPTAGDSFAVVWGETGLVMCAAHCVGGGHTYVQSTTFPRGATESFAFVRGGAGIGSHQGERFGAQAVTLDRGQTVAASFRYGAAGVPTPLTGSPSGLLLGGPVAVLGVVLLIVAWRRPRAASMHDSPGSGLDGAGPQG